MNYLIISPYYPENFQQFTIELAQKEGITVLGIGQEPYEQLGSDLQQALTEYFRVENLEDIDEVKRALAFLFYKHGPIDRIESHNEYWLEQDAILREQFHVFVFFKPRDLKKTKFKSEMKKYFQKAGAPVVLGIVVRSVKDSQRAVKKIGFPMIAKPDNGVGAAATYKLSNQEDLERFLAEWDQSTTYFFEEFVNSNQLCTYDGLIDHQGNIVFETSFNYVYTPLTLITEQKDNAYYVVKEIDPKLQAYGRAIIQAFAMKERFFHIEFFRTADDYIALEYNNRPAGGFTVDVYNFAHSIDLYRDYAQVVAGEPVAERIFETRYCLATTRRNQTQYHYSHEEICEKFAQQLKAVKLMPEAFAALQGDVLYMLTADSEEEVQQMVAEIGRPVF
ncbi:ATP-grasp domain-containing protein [Streptococcus gallinaceus]|uniref:ATP-grasp domain-containing protein n=1 Tax=Streptococcus gallinaceus TaxID=165758 RepID=A0ABV2JMT5_9STRE